MIGPGQTGPISQTAAAGSTQGAASSNSSTVTSTATKPIETAAAVLTEAPSVRIEELANIPEDIRHQSTSASSTEHARRSRPGLASHRRSDVGWNIVFIRSRFSCH